MFPNIEGNKQENKTLTRKKVLKAKKRKGCFIWALFYWDSDYERETDGVYKSEVRYYKLKRGKEKRR